MRGKTKLGKKNSTPFRMDLSDLKHVTADHRIYGYRARVIKPADASSHWRIVSKGGKRRCLVEVETIPGSQDLTCKLSTVAGGAGTGLWFIPKVGTIVRVHVEEGQIDGYPAIVAIEDSGGFPERAGEEQVVLVSEVPVEVTAPRVTLGPNPEQVMPVPMFGLVHGQWVDTLTGVPYAALGACGQFVFAKKA